MSRSSLAMAGVVLLACSPKSERAPCPPPPAALGGPPFVDVTDALGIDAEHHFRTDFCELSDTTAGPGVCLLDYDGDDDLDIYFVDRAPWPNLLYENQGGTFAEVSEPAGAASTADSMGCLAFDHDGDGDQDLYLANLGPDQLLENRGGSFVDVSADVGIAAISDGFSVSASAGDIDLDGDLDVFVGRMVDLATCPTACFLSPYACAPEPNLLLENRGGGYVNVAAERGVDHAEPTLATLMWDFDEDGAIDLFAGNDIGAAFPDRLDLNDGSGSFQEQAARFGLEGPGTDTMGVVPGDFDLDGQTDLVISDFKDRPIRLYRCFDRALACSSEVAPDSTPHVKWAVGLVDFDHDVDLDLFVTSGDVAYRNGDPNYLYFNRGAGKLVQHVPVDGDPVGAPSLSRGAAFGDLDGDGDIDVVIANAGGRHQVLENRVSAGHWLTVALDSRAAGATVTVTSDAGRIREHAIVGGGYAGSSDPRLHFGLGSACRADVTVRYLGGQSVTLPDVAAGQVLRVSR